MTTQTTQQRLEELGKRRARSAGIIDKMLPNKMNEKPYDKKQPLKNAAALKIHFFDPVYRKIVGELRYTVTLYNVPSDHGHRYEHIYDRLKRVSCKLMHQIETRTMDERTYTFLLENSPETIAQHLCYNNWEI